MSQTRRTRVLQTIAYIVSALVALSMILSLIGPLLFRDVTDIPAQHPTATWPPTWTPAPTATALPQITPMVVEPPLPPTASPTVTPTLSTVPTATPQAGLALPGEPVARREPGLITTDISNARLLTQASIEPLDMIRRRPTS